MRRRFALADRVTVGEQVHSRLLQGRNAVVTKPVPNFTRLDPGRPEIAILMDAMLWAREVVAARSWSYLSRAHQRALVG